MFEKIFKKYGFTLVPTGDEFAERYIVTYPQGKLSDELRAALQQETTFQWNAQAMINT